MTGRMVRVRGSPGGRRCVRRVGPHRRRSIASWDAIARGVPTEVGQSKRVSTPVAFRSYRERGGMRGQVAA